MKKIIYTITLMFVAIILMGCDLAQSFNSNRNAQLERPSSQRVRPVETVITTATIPVDPSGDAIHLAHDVVAPQAGEDRTNGAVQEAVGWMKKYTHATEQLMQSATKCMKLKDENRELKSQIIQLQGKNEQYQRELHDANKEILVTNDALEKWKSRVLGLQDLNNKAHEVQLQALYQILKVLGSEMPSNAVSIGKDN